MRTETALFLLLEFRLTLRMLFYGTIGFLYQKPSLIGERHLKEMRGLGGGEYTQLHGQV